MAQALDVEDVRLLPEASAQGAVENHEIDEGVGQLCELSRGRMVASEGAELCNPSPPRIAARRRGRRHN